MNYFEEREMDDMRRQRDAFASNLAMYRHALNCLCIEVEKNCVGSDMPDGLDERWEAFRRAKAILNVNG